MGGNKNFNNIFVKDIIIPLERIFFFWVLL